ncbi:hypothetical protein [Cellulomonas xiejunii]|uniref:hypothetical protein n=1 Tax=Cellulomonas xiejunii TaxID=2968083 RepID=UPI001D0DDAB0|nr:hypothetical protein [Cellulomonas xiejunii]MCC2315464.1 hypothetical protein [Cellulomonas xiejunii]
MTRRPRTLTVVAGALLALALAYLALSMVLARPQVTGASFSAAEVGTAPEAQRRALADGVVTLPEMVAAWKADRACLQAAGYDPGPAGVDGPGTGFEVEVDYSDEADPEAADQTFQQAHRECADEHSALVARAFATQP